MTTTLRFKGSGVQAIVRHMIQAADWDLSWVETVDENLNKLPPEKLPKPRPQLVFVHDDGLYILSNGKPSQMAGPKKRFVVYAVGYDPRDPGVWEKARAAVGGDDFAEYLDLLPQQVAAILAPSFLELTIKVSDKQLEIAVRNRRVQ